METVTLYAWNAIEKSELRTPWFWVGATNSSQRAIDGNYGHITQPVSSNDSNPVDVSDWRTAGGLPFSWANRIPSRIVFEWAINQFNPGAGSIGLALYIADSPTTWFIEAWNGNRSVPDGQSWLGVIDTTDARALAALTAGNLIMSAILFNRITPSQHVGLDAARITVTYTDTLVKQIMWTDI